MVAHGFLILQLVILFWSADALSLYKNGTVPDEPNGIRDLAFVHVPYNFGHTVEYMALWGAGESSMMKFTGVMMANFMKTQPLVKKWDAVYNLVPTDRKHIEIWGAMNPVLSMTSKVGCPLYLTPPKHWPKDIARAYFGNKKRFALLRDPYERLVAMFRGFAGGQTGTSYGGDYSDYANTCDVDGAVRAMMQGAMYEDKYAHGCTFVPQVEYFEGDYGAEIAVDNREFPFSLNKLFREHNYHNTLVEPHDCIHVNGCTETWTTQLSAATKALVRKVYQKDFDFICKMFGYCDENEDTCLKYVPLMCPRNLSLVGDDKPGARPPLNLMPGGMQINWLE